MAGESVARVLLELEDRLTGGVRQAADAAGQAAGETKGLAAAAGQTAEELERAGTAADNAAGGLDRAGRAAEGAARHMGDTAVHATRVGEGAGAAGAGAAKLAGALSILSPALGEGARNAADLADVVEVGSMAIKAFGASATEALMVLGPIALALAAAAVAYKVIATEAENATKKMEESAKKAEEAQARWEKMASARRTVEDRLALAEGRVTKEQLEARDQMEGVRDAYMPTITAKQQEADALAAAAAAKQAKAKTFLIGAEGAASPESLALEAEAAQLLGRRAEALKTVTAATAAMAEEQGKVARAMALEIDQQAEGGNAATAHAAAVADATATEAEDFDAMVSDVESGFDRLRIAREADAQDQVDTWNGQLEAQKKALDAQAKADADAKRAAAERERAAEEATSAAMDRTNRAIGIASGPQGSISALGNAGPIGAIAAAFIQIAADFEGFANQWADWQDKIAEGVSQLPENILHFLTADGGKRMMDPMIDAIPKFVSSLAKAIGPLIEAAAANAPKMAGQFVEALIVEMPKAAWEFVKVLLDPKTWLKAGEAFVQSLQAVLAGDTSTTSASGGGASGGGGGSSVRKGGSSTQFGTDAVTNLLIDWIAQGQAEHYAAGVDYRSKGGIAWVGEGEAVVPRTGATSQRVSQGMQGAGGGTHVHLHIGNGVVMGDAETVARVLHREIVGRGLPGLG